MNVSKGFVAFVMLTVTLLLNSINVTTSASSGIHIRQENASRHLSTAAAAAVVSGALDVDASSAPDTHGSCQHVYRIALLFSYGGKKVSGWNDGFPTALRYLETHTCTKIVWVDVSNTKCTSEFRRNPKAWLEANADVVIVKSNWGWIPEKFAWKKLRGISIPIILAVAGVATPPTKRDPARFLFYKALLYEVEWYYPQIEQHPVVVHAFGVNDALLKPIPHSPKIYDYIFIGQLGRYKRVQELMSRKGRRLALGTTVDGDVVKQMKANGIEVIPAVPYNTLPAYLSMSQTLLAPMPVSGGGERAVLEARACGTNVEFSEQNDNPKLLELATSPVWNHEYYAYRIMASVCHVLKAGKGGEADMRLHLRASQENARMDVVGHLACIPLRNLSSGSSCAA